LWPSLLRLRAPWDAFGRANGGDPRLWTTSMSLLPCCLFMRCLRSSLLLPLQLHSRRQPGGIKNLSSQLLHLQSKEPCRSQRVQATRSRCYNRLALPGAFKSPAIHRCSVRTVLGQHMCKYTEHCRIPPGHTLRSLPCCGVQETFKGQCRDQCQRDFLRRSLE